MNEIREDIKRTTEEVILLKTENAELKVEVEKLKKERLEDRKRIQQMESASKKYNLLIRGLAFNKDATVEVLKLFKQKLQIQEDVPIRDVKIISKFKGEMSVLVELICFDAVAKVLRETKKLTGTNISIQRDLTEEGKKRRSAMMCLKSEILKVDKSQLLVVQGDKLKVGKAVFYWRAGNLMFEDKDGVAEIKNIYKKDFKEINFDYNILIELAERNFEIKRIKNSF